MKISCQLKGSIYWRNLAKRAGLKHGRRLLLSSHIIINQNGIVSAPIRSTLHLLTFYVSFQAWYWPWNPMLWSQWRNMGVYGAEEISIQISALVGTFSDLGI